MHADFGNYTIPIIALLGTLFGGAGLEFIKRWLGKAKERDDTATALRNELRGELTSLKKELANVEKELDEWKAKYYEVVERYLTIKIQYENALRLLAEKKIEEPREITLPSSDPIIDTKTEPGVQ
jgi:hypothetical protein